MPRKSVMAHQFSQVPSAEIQRSSFLRRCGLKTAFDAGFLVPIFVDEVLPGDTFNMRATTFGRLATPIHPVLDNLFLDTFYFFVPNRLLWSNWEKFNGAQDNPADSTDFLVPTITTAAGFVEGSLSDYFGIPTQVAGLEVNSLHHRAYNLIYNEWFRDENLQDSVVVDLDNGPDNEADYVLLRRGKRHDYFTSALPWPQKGPSVPLPLLGNAPVLPDAIEHTTGGSNALIMRSTAGATFGGRRELAVQAAGQVESTVGAPTFGTGAQVYPTNLSADLSAVTAATINELRQAFQIQKLYERDARGGTRYIEILRSHFGVVSPDARLQRPEYLGGGSSRISVNSVAQTSSTDGTSPQGHLAAFGTVNDSNGFTKSFVEHGVIIGLASVRADLNYQQGLNRMWSRQTRWDFYWPALAHLGEQAVLSKEIYADGSANDEDVFGYQERYAEYRYKPSQVTGPLRSNAAGTLDTWHLAQDFATRPLLNSSFIVDDPPVDRVIAVPSEPHILFDAFFDLRCARPMPVYGVPGLIDHF